MYTFLQPHVETFLQPHVEMYMYGKYCSYYVEVQCLTGCLAVLHSRTAGLNTVKKQQLKWALTSVQILFLSLRAATLASALLFLFSTCNFFFLPPRRNMPQWHLPGTSKYT